MARPTKLTPSLSKALLDAIRIGLPYTRACAEVGIDYSTFRDWQAKGTGHDARQPFKQFTEDLELAKVQGLSEKLTLIEKAGEKEWRALAWLLEKQWPEQYGRRRL